MIQFQYISVRLSAANLSVEERERILRLRSMASSWRDDLVAYCLGRLADYNRLSRSRRNHSSLRF